MKRIILAVFFLSLSYNALFSQGIRAKEDPENLFYLATEQFQEKEFPSCYRTIETWIEKSDNSANLEEAYFLRAASAYELNKRETSILLIQFLEKYPSSPFSSKAYYLLGCSALNARQYKDASDFFQHCSASDFSPKELNDYRFRFAYVSLLLGDNETARKLFGEIMEGESRYVGSATYFSAYMDYTEGKMKDAMNKFNKISDHSQYKNAVPYFNLQLLYIDGQFDKMIDQAEQLFTKDPTSEEKIELNRLMGAAFFEKKDYKLSQKYYQDYLSLNPKVRRPDLYRIGVNNYILKNYDTAIGYLTKVTESYDAISQSSTYHIGLCYLEQDKKDMARASFLQASLSDFDKPTKEKALYNYALICYKTTFLPYKEQVDVFERFLNEFSDSESAGKVDGYLADLFLSSTDYENSLAELQKIAHPNQRLLQAKSQILFLLGTDRYNNKLYKEASDFFTQSIDLENSLSLSAAESYFWRGEAYYQLNQLSAASESFMDFINSPEASKMNAYPIVLYDQGYCFFNLKKYTEALKWFEKYTALVKIKREKTYADALNRMGDSYFQALDYTKALKCYQNADLNSSGGNDYATYQKSLISGLRKDYNSKITILNNFETRFPKSDYRDDALFEMGRTYILLQKPDKAIATLNHLMDSFKESPLSPKAGLQIALLYDGQGENENAIATYKKVLENYPETQEAHEASIALNGQISYEKKDASETDDTKTNDVETNVVDAIETDTEKQDSASSNTSDYFTLEVNNKKDSNTDPMLLLAETAYTDKDYSKALTNYKKLETLSTDNSTRIKAETGKMRCLYYLKKYKEAIATADLLISDSDLSKDLLRESMYYRAMALLSTGQKDKAKADFESLSAEGQTAYGAEARYRLADYYFNQANLKESEKAIQDLINEGTPQSYWLARCYILLADIKIQQKKDLQAKQYLLSLKENYKTVDDIQGMISTRLNAIAKRSK